MRRNTGKRMGLALMLVALCARFLIATGLEAAADAVMGEMESPAFRRLVLAVGTGTYPEEKQEASKQLWVVKRLTAEQTVPPQEEKAPIAPFTAEEAANIKVGGGSTYEVDKQSLLLAPSKVERTEGPAVLIVHTHTSEAYSQTTGWAYEESDRLRTTDSAHSVVRVGQEIAAVLEARGISVLHDTSYNDYPDYSGSYTRTMGKIQKHLAANPSVQVVLDIHRDALEAADGTPLHSSVTLPDGTKSAKLMLVVGTDEGGTHHPNWRDNLSWALKVQTVLERRAAGICRNLDLRTERFNQHLSPKSMLVEVGATGNTLPEALAAARVFADALADVMEASAR